jgi:hypothetical protein
VWSYIDKRCFITRIGLETPQVVSRFSLWFGASLLPRRTSVERTRPESCPPMGGCAHPSAVNCRQPGTRSKGISSLPWPQVLLVSPVVRPSAQPTTYWFASCLMWTQNRFGSRPQTQHALSVLVDNFRFQKTGNHHVRNCLPDHLQTMALGNSPQKDSSATSLWNGANHDGC